jgi:hypothetical protein
MMCEGARKEENDGITTKATQDLCIAICVCVARWVWYVASIAWWEIVCLFVTNSMSGARFTWRYLHRTKPIAETVEQIDERHNN